jgi:hypothetical protein
LCDFRAVQDDGENNLRGHFTLAPCD